MIGTTRPSKRERLESVRIYLITDAEPRVRPIETFLREAVAGGAGMVQLREKSMSDGALLEVARSCAAVCRELEVPFIVNDRLDIALASGADGVHLGQDDLPVETARHLGGEDLIIGLSTHSPEQINAAGLSSADYIGVGPIHATPTKEGRTPVGTELVRYAAQHATQPFFAIGGLDPANVSAVLDAGATGVSVLRWIAQAADPRTAARELLKQIDGVRRHSPARS